METIQNFIAGRWCDAAGGGWLDTTEPATGAAYARVPDSDGADVDAAVNAAADAFPAWSAMAASERARLLLRLADLIDQNLENLARAESIDSGKPLSLARAVDIPRAASNFRFFAHAVTQSSSEFFDTDLRTFNYTLRRPRGVAGLISPWNLPLYLLTWKIAPAIATGNTCVAKPSEVTPMTAFLLSKLIAEAGIPPGVVNIVHGNGPRAGAALVTHPRVPAISFTGSTGVGKWIAQHAGPMFKRLSLELGGKNPFIVFDDARMPDALDVAVRAAFTNQGQICLCGSRLLVQQGIYNEFVEGFVARARALKVGDPLEETTQQGALSSEAHREKVASYVRLARELGGRVLCGGEPPAGASLPERVRRGSFFSPTVIAGLDPLCRVEQEEIFGPVVTVQPFTDEAHAISLANSTPYGLAATVWTSDLGGAHRVAARLDAGIIWINTWMNRDLRTPFGGMKQSGVGREGGAEALKFFTEPRNVTVVV